MPEAPPQAGSRHRPVDFGSGAEACRPPLCLVQSDMANFLAPPFFSDSTVSAIPGPTDEKIIQRNEAAELSDGEKAARTSDADLELVLRSRRGDAAAFEELVRQYQHMIHALTYRLTGSLADAEDLAQETFLRAYGQLAGFRGQARFSTWLYRIAVNICLNWRQSEARRFRLYAAAAAELSEARAASPAPADESGEVAAALLKLPAKQRAAVVLTIYEGLSHGETAQILGCSETTVSWRVFAAKRKLKRLLAAAGRPGASPTANS